MTRIERTILPAVPAACALLALHGWHHIPLPLAPMWYLLWFLYR